MQPFCVETADGAGAGQTAIGLPADADVRHGHESRMFGVNRHLMRLSGSFKDRPL
jgi:hypothetical protein